MSGMFYPVQRLMFSIYSPYSYTGVDASPPTPDLINLESETETTIRDTPHGPKAIISEVFLFEYGVTVIWGMTEAEEKRFLKEIAKFEVDPLRTSLYKSSLMKLLRAERMNRLTTL